MAQSDSLYRVQEFPEIFVDACLRNSEGEFKFLSMYGRDGSVLQFEAAMQLGPKDGGIMRFNLVNDAGNRHPVEVGAVARLGKFTGRLPRQNLFGPLTQAWLYDKALQELDRPNRIGWVVHRAKGSDSADDVRAALLGRAWDMTKRLCPVALLDGWREDLQAWCSEALAYERLADGRYPPIGPVEALRVSISDHFLRHVSAGVKEGRLALA